MLTVVYYHQSLPLFLRGCAVLVTCLEVGLVVSYHLDDDSKRKDVQAQLSPINLVTRDHITRTSANTFRVGDWLGGAT
ncbi:hypothetical protein M405DRAFT_192272 [Rhizopogon salebrosus TDB-379]|nr:hypothetical protein M405DRAFT_192272 [Rhizopogon salebrosus TDB-379]